MTKNEVRNVLFKYQMKKLRHSAVFSPEANQIPIKSQLVKYNTTLPSTVHVLYKTLIHPLLLLAGVQMGNEKIVMLAVFSTFRILYQG